MQSDEAEVVTDKSMTGDSEKEDGVEVVTLEAECDEATAAAEKSLSEDNTFQGIFVFAVCCSYCEVEFDEAAAMAATTAGLEVEVAESKGQEAEAVADKTSAGSLSYQPRESWEPFTPPPRLA